MWEYRWGLLEFATVVVFLNIMSNQLKDSKESLESIDKKMHTHAADGSINGIRGWY